jgi:DNA-binding transcriptional LysR family regulator
MFVITGGYDMNINFELYRIFYTVANTQNITKAAEELMISQPAISKSIKNLEDQLGGQLFIRTKRGVILTEEGKELYKYIKQAIEYINNAENKFSELINLETGTIKIGVSSTLTKEFLLPYLEKFHKLYPKVNISINTDISSELIKKIRNGLIDIIIMNLNENNYDNDLDIIKCKKIKDCFVVNDNFKDLLNRKITLEELNNYPIILQSIGSNTRTFLDNFTKEYNVILKPNMELASYSLVVEFARIGLGIGYVTENYIKDDLNNKRLYKLKLKEKIPERYIGIALSKNNIPNFSTKKMIEIITKNS